MRAFEHSAAALGLERIVVYLIHRPAPARDRCVDSWRALVRLREEVRARSNGVFNFQPEHLERIISETGVPPTLNQIELDPGWQSRDLRALHARQGIVTEAWSPLGHGAALGRPVVVARGGRLSVSDWTRHTPSCRT